VSLVPVGQGPHPYDRPKVCGRIGGNLRNRLRGPAIFRMCRPESSFAKSEAFAGSAPCAVSSPPTPPRAGCRGTIPTTGDKREVLQVRPRQSHVSDPCPKRGRQDGPRPTEGAASPCSLTKPKPPRSRRLRRRGCAEASGAIRQRPASLCRSTSRREQSDTRILLRLPTTCARQAPWRGSLCRQGAVVAAIRPGRLQAPDERARPRSRPAFS